MRNLMDITDLSVTELQSLMALADDISSNPQRYGDALKGKKLATLFFEPSTRTRLSFEAAMYELGGNCLGFSEPKNSSVSKGESIADTSKVISQYADIIAMRHPLEGAPLVAAQNASVPVINAGDGGHCHPTQTLADLYTIYRKKGKIKNLTVGVCGDLKFGRTVHSLLAALSRYDGIHVVLISPKELELPEYVMKQIPKAFGMTFEKDESLEHAVSKLDILYMTRVQKERFQTEADYERLKDCYILNAEKMGFAKKDLVVLHPLPRVNEIDPEIDSDPRACYFEQVLCGKYMRMALILTLLSPEFFNASDCNRGSMVRLFSTAKFQNDAESELERSRLYCKNPSCITSTEIGLQNGFVLKEASQKEPRCPYCDAKLQ